MKFDEVLGNKVDKLSLQKLKQTMIAEFKRKDSFKSLDHHLSLTSESQTKKFDEINTQIYAWQ